MTLDVEWNALQWGSHLPSLIACLSASDGQVLEIGIGHFSTPALHALCISSQRNLVSVEKDCDWFRLFATKFTSGGHEFLQGEYDDVLPMLALQHWGVVFIDHSPGGERRATDFRRFIHSADYVVVHDYHDENETAIQPIVYELGANYHVSKEYMPPTLVASMFKPMPIGLFA